jgi:hypothetical protein
VKLINKKEMNREAAVRRELYEGFMNYLLANKSPENIDESWRGWACALYTNEVYFELAKKCVEYSLPCPDPGFSSQVNYGERDVIIRKNKVSELRKHPPLQLNEWMPVIACDMSMVNLLLATAGNTRSIVKGVLEAHFLPQSRQGFSLPLEIFDSYLKLPLENEQVRVTILSATSVLGDGPSETHFFAMVGCNQQYFIFDTYVNRPQAYGMPYEKMMNFLAGENITDSRLESFRELIGALEKNNDNKAMTGAELNEHWQKTFNNIKLSREAFLQPLADAFFTISTHVTQKERLNQFFACQLANYSYEAPPHMRQKIKRFLADHQLDSAVVDKSGVNQVASNVIGSFGAGSSSMFGSRELRAQVDRVCSEIKSLVDESVQDQKRPDSSESMVGGRIS